MLLKGNGSLSALVLCSCPWHASARAEAAARIGMMVVSMRKADCRRSLHGSALCVAYCSRSMLMHRLAPLLGRSRLPLS